ncbi:MAG: hypothetical protein Q9162_005699 [Coniocarpon cinnabarinum]
MAESADPPPARTKISLSSRAKPLSKPAAPSNGTKRSRALLGDDDEETEEYASTDHKITSFGAGASDRDRREKTPPRVIAPLANKDWRAEGQRKRQKSALPGKDVDGDASVDDPDDQIASGQVKAGLQVLHRASPSRSPSAWPEPTPNRSIDDQTNGLASSPPPDSNGKPETDESRALAALTNTQSHQSQIISPRTEDQAFARDYADAPPSPTLAQYDSTPVDGFGAALLRGYLKPGQSLESWKTAQEDAMNASRKGKNAGIERRREGRRPDLLGMGAKEIDIGEQGKGKANGVPKGNQKRGVKREQESYAPVLRRNRITGEIVSEAELQERIQSGGPKMELLLEGPGPDDRRGRDDFEEKDRKDSRRRYDDEEKRDRNGRESERRDRGDGRDREARDRERDRTRKKDRKLRERFDSDDERNRRKRDRYERDRHSKRYRDGSRERQERRRDRSKDEYDRRDRSRDRHGRRR